MPLKHRPFRVVSCLVLLIAAAGAGDQPQRTLDPAAAKEDALLARRAIELIHPGLDRYVPRATIDAAFDRFIQKCGQPISERDFYAGLSLVLAQIRCSHTKAEPSEAWVRWRENSPTHLPFKFIEDHGRMIVTRSATDLIRVGEEVVSIDGVSARTVLSTIFNAVPADGWTDAARSFALSSMSDLDESELDHFYPAFFEVKPTVRLELRQRDEAVSRVADAPMMTRAARLAAVGQPAAPRNLDEAVSLDIQPSGTAVLRVGTFVAYRKKITPEEVYKPLFEQIAKCRAHTLILDLRDNGGGSDSAAIDLARFLVDQPFALKNAAWVKTFRFGDLKDRLETWDRSVLEMPAERFTDLGNGYFELRSEAIEPQSVLEPRFTGRLIVLCGPANASGATLFISGLRERRKLTLVGEPTGGNATGPTAGVILFLPLPNSGIKVRIPAIRSVTQIQGANPAGGVDPDVLVRPSLDDRLNGRDVVLERALQLTQGR